MRNYIHGLTVVALCIAAGCASVPENAEPIFFPAPPAKPRIQFLKSYGHPSDIERPGWFLTFLAGVAPSKRGFLKPYGIAAAPGMIYLTDSLQGLIRTFDFENNKVGIVPRRRGAAYRKPINVGLDEDGNIYIADTVGNAVFALKPDGSMINIIGMAEGIKKPGDVVVRENRVYITDMDDKSVKVFDKTSNKLIFKIPRENDVKEAGFNLPINLALDSKNNIYVVDAFKFRVTKYAPDGKYIGSIGEHGDMPGQFGRPKGIAIDREDRVYVVDARAMVVQIFDQEGRSLAFFGEPASERAALLLPAQVVIDYDNVKYFTQYAADDFELEFLIWVTAQYGDRKICLYGFGHRK